MTGLAAIFDMDGLLLDTEQTYLDAFVTSRRHFGMADNPEVFLSVIGLRPVDAVPIVEASFTTDVSYHEFRKVWDDRIAQMLAKEMPVQDGAIELAQILQSKGVGMAVATSSPTKLAMHHLDQAGLLSFFDHVVGGDQVVKGKPDPAIYLRAASKLGLDPASCVAFEDSMPGATAAMAAGCLTVQVPDLIPPTDEFRRNGHIIADNLLLGAQRAGLITQTDIDGNQAPDPDLDKIRP